MKKLSTDIWNSSNDVWIGVTTNGTVKRNGCLVMGRGVALQAKNHVPSIDLILGDHVETDGNICAFICADLERKIFSFPVKDNWWERANLKLIASSTAQLKVYAEKHPDQIFYLPKPGCGNGGLQWSDVEEILSILPDNVYIVDYIW